jgi:hypothetical protein
MRIVWTKDTFYVARPNESRIIDSLPLFEIQAVMEMNEEADASFKSTGVMNRTKGVFADRKDGSQENIASAPEATFFSRNSTIKCVLQIKTVIDSEIAGRTLYLSTRNDTDPEQLRKAVVSSLWNAVEAARRKALAMSRFQKSQEKVRWVQGSLLFQIAMAILIMLVTIPIDVNRPFSER